MIPSVPILSCSVAGALEQRRFGGEEAAEWPAMQRAGAGVAAAALRDAEEIGGISDGSRLLVLVGKGHNGGDALLAAEEILRRRPHATAEVLFVFGERPLRPLAARAWRQLVERGGDRVRRTTADRLGAAPYDLAIDGVFGFQFRPPVTEDVAAVLDAVNAARVRFRAAVDLPSANRFRADFTYATGSVKDVLLDNAAAGRPRFIDLGFFDDRAGDALPDTGDRVLTAGVLDPLRGWRAARSDKRSYGHVFLLGGSRGFPGAILMAALAAHRSGAGLVTAFVPESLAPAYAARLPEVMWVGWPETPTGSLALEGEHLVRARLDRADALVLGPGLGREPETLALVESLVRSSAVPLVLDADALQSNLVLAGSAARVVTPHAGEFRRIAGSDADLRSFAARAPQLTVVLKGPVSRICSGGPVYHAFTGGPVLARGGSGDLLAGMVGTQLAQGPTDPTGAAARAVVWHGTAADALARAHGPVAVGTTQLLDYLAAALRDPE